MNKFRAIGTIIVVVIIAYIIMLGMQPATNAIIESVNSTANWSGHADYEKAQAVLLGWRWWQWFVPGALGIAATVVVLIRNRGR